VPRAVVLGLGLPLFSQIAWQATQHSGPRAADDLPPAPGPQALRLASFGESEAAARVCMVYLQSFDFPRVDLQRALGWLQTTLEVDARSQYPLFLAARVYAESADPVRKRAVLEFVYQEFLKDPNRRWPWLAHAALLAKHRLNDLALARRYAHAVQEKTTARDVPLWARQMEIFILEDMNELEAARIMIGGMLQSGTLTDPAEIRFLKERLDQLDGK
jgi:hypothetical protein